MKNLLTILLIIFSLTAFGQLSYHKKELPQSCIIKKEQPQPEIKLYLEKVQKTNNNKKAMQAVTVGYIGFMGVLTMSHWTDNYEGKSNSPYWLTAGALTAGYVAITISLK